MSTTKKPVATLTKKEETKATPVAAKVEVKEEVKAVETKTAEVKETAKKAPATKAKASAKETVKKAPAKKAATAKKETATAAKTTKASKKEVKIAIQFADKNYTSEDLANIANDVWVYDYGKKASELKEVQLYVKPEESKVYYVFNDEITGDFNI